MSRAHATGLIPFRTADYECFGHLRNFGKLELPELLAVLSWTCWLAKSKLEDEAVVDRCRLRTRVLLDDTLALDWVTLLPRDDCVLRVGIFADDLGESSVHTRSPGTGVPSSEDTFRSNVYERLLIVPRFELRREAPFQRNDPATGTVLDLLEDVLRIRRMEVLLWPVTLNPSDAENDDHESEKSEEHREAP